MNIFVWKYQIEDEEYDWKIVRPEIKNTNLRKVDNEQRK